MHYTDFLQKNLVHVLEESKGLIQRMVDFQAAFLAIKFEKPITEIDKEHIEVGLVRDLCIAFGNYILPTDILTDVHTKFDGTLCIQCKVSRDATSHHFSTQLIKAGGHNIQCRHYRYITDTDIYKLNVNRIALSYKKADRISSIQKQMDQSSYQHQKMYASMEQKIRMTDHEILSTDPYAFGRWNDINEYAKAIYKTAESYELEQERRRHDKIYNHRYYNNEIRLKQMVKSHQKTMEHFQKKINKLNA